MLFSSIFYLVFKATASKKPLWPFLLPYLKWMALSLHMGTMGLPHSLSYHPCQGASELLDIIAIRLAGTWEKPACGLDLIPAVTCTVPGTCMFIAWTTFMISSWSFWKALLKSNGLCEIRSDHQVDRAEGLEDLILASDMQLISTVTFSYFTFLSQFHRFVHYTC